MPTPAIVGLTGGIGSGKSTVARRLAGHNIPVESADTVVHRLYDTSEPVRTAVAHLLGQDVRFPDGRIDRSVVRTRTLTQPGDDPATVARKDLARTALMALLDPFIWDALVQHRQQHAAAPFVVWEIPLLIEVAWHPRMDHVVVVDCPKPVQIARVKARNGWDDTTIDGVLERQASREERLALADEVIGSDVSWSTLEQRVDALAQRLNQRYAGHVHRDPPHEGVST